MKRQLRVALVGGGLGGLAAAFALRQRGFDVEVFEQASQQREVGAGIGIGPNAVKVLRALGLESALRARGFEAHSIVGRNWTTGEALFRVPMKDASEARYGSAHVQIHRADLLEILVDAGLKSKIHLNSRAHSVSSADQAATLALSDGRQEDFDLIVGCDGLRSMVRAAIHGLDTPRFTGHVCWRALIPTENLPPNHVPPDMTVWFGEGGHILTYYVRGGRLVNVVAFREAADWAEKSWSVPSPTSDLLQNYPGVHLDLRVALERAKSCFKWGLFDREPLSTWTRQRVTLLGDAAHPMLPFLGQGAATAIEDGYVLARELANSPDDVGAALRAYEAERIPRTSRIQNAARDQPRFVHHTDSGADLNSDWLYSYDATRPQS